MKKSFAIILLISILCTLLFSGCHLSHNWVDANCYLPQRCTGCDLTVGEPKGHMWDRPTCTDPATCGRCGETGEPALGHNWIAETEYTPELCANCGEMVPMANPANGQVFIGEDPGWGQTLTIICSNQACYVKMKDASYNDVLSFYVAAGSTAEVCVPSGQYYVYFAHGTDWYGPEFLFGPDTSYSMDSELTDYVDYSWEYNFQPVTDGNFTSTDIGASDF